MTRHALQPEGLATPKAPYSPVVISGDHVFTAGQVGCDMTGELVPGGVAVQAGLPAGILVEIEAVARRPA